MHEFGTNLGIAYQIYDDCVDIFGQERQAGKSLGTDMKKGKLTLPFLLLLHHTSAAERRGLGEAIFRNDPTEHMRLLHLALGNGVVAESLLTIDRFIARAEASLIDLPSNIYSQTLLASRVSSPKKSRLLLKEEVAA